MKLLTFVTTNDPATPRLGALLDDGARVADLQQGYTAEAGSPSLMLTDMLSLLDGGETGRELANKAFDYCLAQPDVAQPCVAQPCVAQPDTQLCFSLEDVRLLAPVPRPRSIRDCISFERHIVQATRTVAKWRFRPLAALDAWVEGKRGRALIGAPSVWYEQPLYYKSNTFSVVGPDADIRWPRYTERLDFELEFGIFIGRKGCNISRESAHEYIAGYTIFNDFSARDVQLREMGGRLGPAKGKDFDTGNSLGPYLVTADEIDDPSKLTMIARINGEEWSRGNSGDMHFSFADIIAHISQEETLYPGECIGSGTVGGGCGLELDRWIQPNDVVELEVEGLGILRNRVIK